MSSRVNKLTHNRHTCNPLNSLRIREIEVIYIYIYIYHPCIATLNNNNIYLGDDIVHLHREYIYINFLFFGFLFLLLIIMVVHYQSIDVDILPQNTIDANELTSLLSDNVTTKGT